MTQRVAAILTCHNRVEKTLSALRSLEAQEGCEDVLVSVHLVDDGSTDGTAERVAEEFPKTSIIMGDGQLFWDGGMRLAFAAALDEGYDYYLWLNDDTDMDPDALWTLLRTHRQVSERLSRSAIIAGSTRDPDTGFLTYGGLRRHSRLRPLHFVPIPPRDVPRPVETMNGNTVLIPRAVAQQVGNIERAYRHGLGDLDYGLRARTAGFEVWITPGMIGACARNPPRLIGERPLLEEWRGLRSIKQLPMDQWRVFSRRWAGPLWPVYWLSPYVRRGTELVWHRFAGRLAPVSAKSSAQ